MHNLIRNRKGQMAIRDSDRFRLGEWQVSPSLHRIRRGTDERALEPKVMQVLVCLAARPGAVVSHDELIDEVWDGMAVSGNVVTYSIAALRKALEDDWRAPRYIETISKSGYRLLMDVQPAAGAADDPAEAAPVGGAGSVAAAREIAVAPPSHDAPAPLAEAAAASAGGSRRIWILAGLGGALLALGAVGAARVLVTPPDGPAMLQPVPVTAFPGSEIQPTLSPDGNHIAFAWMKEGRPDRDLYVMLVGAETPSPLATSEDNERSPAWTPDGLYVAFASWKMDGSDCGIYRIPAVGGTRERIASCPGRVIGNMSFSPDGGLLAVGALGPAGEPAQIFVIRLATGETWGVGDPPADRQGDYYPVFSPDGGKIVFNRFRGDGLSDLYTVAPDGSGITRVTFDNRDIGGADWSADGETIYFSSYRSGRYTLWSVPAAGGEPRPVAINDHQILSLSLSHRQGRIAYSKNVTDINLWATRVDGDGTPVPLGASVSAARAEAPGFWPAHDEPAPILSSTMWDAHPQISPDGARVAFASDRSGSFEIYSAAPDGSDLRRHTAFGGPFAGSPRWLPDGRRLVFDARPDGHADIWSVEVESSAPRRLTFDPDDDFAASFSADGAWIYFTSHRSGSWQIWRLPAAGGEPEQITTDGAYSALEGPAGDYLYFTRYGEDGIWRLPLAGAPAGGELGAAESFFPAVGILDWGSWVIRPEGLYFFLHELPAIVRYQPDTGDIVPIVPLSGGIARQTPALSVSADGRLVVWAQIDASADDIYLAEGIGR